MDTILFFVSSTRHSCHDRLNGILAVAQRRKWNVQVIERAFQRIDVAAAIDFWKPIGIIAECGSRAEEMNRKTFGAIPAVYFERDPALGRGDTMLMLDSTAVGHLAATELLASGVKNFAFVPFSRDPTIYWSLERGKAFADTIVKAGHEVLVPNHPGDVRLLKQFITNLPRPCAIFAANDQVAVEIISIAHSIGIEIPHDLQVLGVDNDLDICEKANPPLSSIDPGFLDAGLLAAEELEALIEHKKRDSKLIKFSPTGTVRRASTFSAPLLGKGSLSANVEAFISANVEHGLNVPAIAKAFGLSRRTLEINYRREAKRTLLTAIHDAIFNRAIQMVRTRHIAPSAIPDFLQVSHDTINRIFVARTGQSLNAWLHRKTTGASLQESSTPISTPQTPFPDTKIGYCGK